MPPGCLRPSRRGCAMKSISTGYAPTWFRQSTKQSSRTPPRSGFAMRVGRPRANLVGDADPDTGIEYRNAIRNGDRTAARYHDRRHLDSRGSSRLCSRMISREGRDSTGVVNNGPSGLNSALPQGERAVSIAARSIWCLTAAVAGLSLIPILRNSFVAVYHYCGHDNCVSGQLTAVAARGLESAGLPPTAYAVSAAIVWRRSSDPMALLTAFTLTLFGGATLTNGARLLGPASVWFEPFTVLAMLGSLGIG